MGQTSSSAAEREYYGEEREEGGGNHRSRSRFSSARRHRARRSHSVPSGNQNGSQSLSVPSISRNSKESSLYKAIRKKLLGAKHSFSHVVTGGVSPKFLGTHPSTPSGTLGSRNPVSFMLQGGGVRGKAAKDHAKIFRELVSGWTAQDLHCLVVEYEASQALRELCWRSDSAHPHATTLKEDLGQLFEERMCSDLTLVFENLQFPVHSRFLSHRSTFFRQLLAGREHGEMVRVLLPHNFAPISPATFGLLLQYLYTGEISTEARAGVGNEIELILRLKDEFGCPHTLDHDAYTMLQQAKETGDAILVFVSNSCSTPLPPPSPVPLVESPYFTDSLPQLAEASGEDDGGRTLRRGDRPVTVAVGPGISVSEEAEDGTVFAGDEMNIWRQGLQELSAEGRNCGSRPLSLASSGTPQHTRHSEFRCHSAILAARSPFFRSLIQKRLAERKEAAPQHPASTPPPPIQILLDESVIPRIYAPVLLHALYTDQVDLSQVIRGCPVSVNSLSEVQAIASGKCQVSPIDEATEIYQIARFLEFDALAQGCENIVAHHISVDCLPSVYNWSVESYGSSFVRRHSVNFLCREFSRVASSQLLFDLEESLLYETLRSDFVQASELEILQAVVRWGEHQLIRRLEEREPNLISGTTHSITRKGVRRSDMSDEEMKEILSNLMPLVRTDFILPSYHQALVQATSRGLISSPPTDLPGTINRSTNGSDSSARPSGSKVATTSGPVAYSAADVGEGFFGSHPDGHWFHPHSSNTGPLAHRLTPRPRFFVPYYKEARNQLQKKLQEYPDQQILSHHPPHCLSSSASGPGRLLPDTLYMVGNQVGQASVAGQGVGYGGISQEQLYGPLDSLLDFEDQGSMESVHRIGQNNSWTENPDEFPLPEWQVIEGIRQRISTYLRTSSTVQKGLSCGCSYHRKAVLTQVCLRAIRESGCPDSCLRILRSPSTYYPQFSALERPSSAASYHLPSSLFDSGQASDGRSEANVGPIFRSSRFTSEPYLSQPLDVIHRPQQSPTHPAHSSNISGTRLPSGFDLPPGYEPEPPVEAWPDLMSSTTSSSVGVEDNPSGIVVGSRTSLSNASASSSSAGHSSQILGEERAAEMGAELHKTCEYVSWWSAQASASLENQDASFVTDSSIERNGAEDQAESFDLTL